MTPSRDGGDRSAKDAIFAQDHFPRDYAENDVPVGFPARKPGDAPALALGPRFPKALRLRRGRPKGRFLRRLPTNLPHTLCIRDTDRSRCVRLEQNSSSAIDRREESRDVLGIEALDRLTASLE